MVPDDAGGLVVKLEARIDAFEQQMNKAVRGAYGAAADIQKAFQETNKTLETQFAKANLDQALGRSLRGVTADIQGLTGRVPVLGSALSSLGVIGLAAGGAIALGFRQAKEAIDFAHELEVTAKSAGVTTDRLQELQYVALKAGATSQQMGEALISFNGSLGRAEEGLKRALNPFKALFGADTSRADIIALAQRGDALERVIKALAQLDITGRTAIANQLGLGSILPVINQIADGLNNHVDLLAQWQGEAKQVGFVMDAELIKRSGDLKTQWDILNRTIKVEMYDAIVGLAPALIWLLEQVRVITNAFGDLIGSFQTVQNRSTKLLQTQLAEAQGTVQRLGAINPQTDVRPQLYWPQSWTGRPQNAPQVPLPGWMTNLLGGPQRTRLSPTEQQALDRARQTIQTIQPLLEQRAAAAAKPPPVTPPGRPPSDISQPKKGPRDRTQEQIDRFNQQMAKIAGDEVQVMDDELHSLEERASIHQTMLRYQEQEALAQIDRQVATKGLTAAQGEELKAATRHLYNTKAFEIAQLDLIKLSQQRISNARELIDLEKETFGYVAAENATEEQRLKLKDALLVQDRATYEKQLQLEADLLRRQGATPEEAQGHVDLNLAKYDHDVRVKQNDANEKLLDAQIEILQLTNDLLLTNKQKSQNDREILAIQHEERLARIKLNASIYDNVDAEIAKENERYQLEQQRQTISEHPILQDLQQGLDDVGKASENLVVHGLATLRSGLADAILNAKDLGEVARDVFRQIASDLINMLLRQVTNAIEQQLAKSLGLGGGGGLGGLAGSILGVGGSFWGGGGGLLGGSEFLDIIGFQSGTSSAPGGWSLVGENGPELLNIPKGTQVIPNTQLRMWSLNGGGSGGGGPIVFDLRGAVVTEDLLRQMNEISMRHAIASTQASRMLTKDDFTRMGRRSLR